MAVLQRANTLRIAMQEKGDTVIDAQRQADRRWTRTGLRMGAVLLCVYAAMHLAAVGIVRLITGQDPAAFLAPNAPAAITSADSREGSTDPGQTSGPPGKIAASAGRAQACKPDRAIDTRCIDN